MQRYGSAGPITLPLEGEITPFLDGVVRPDRLTGREPWSLYRTVYRQGYYEVAIEGMANGSRWEIAVCRGHVVKHRRTWQDRATMERELLPWLQCLKIGFEDLSERAPKAGAND